MRNDYPYRMDVAVVTPGYDTSEKQLEALRRYNLENFCDFISEKPDFYWNWDRNQHHWTTNFVWENVIEKILAFVGVSPSADDFELIENIIDGNDVSFHRYTGNKMFAYKSLSDNVNLIGNHDILRDLKSKHLSGNEYTGYHRLFVGAHKSCQVFNLNPENDIRVRFNADSMSIPVIPLVIPFVREILVVDVHRKPNDRTSVEKFNETHIVSMCSMFNANSVFGGRA